MLRLFSLSLAPVSPVQEGDTQMIQRSQYDIMIQIEPLHEEQKKLDLSFNKKKVKESIMIL